MTTSGAGEARERWRSVRNRFIFVAIVVLACAAVTVGVFVGQGSDQQAGGLTNALGLEGQAPTRHVRMDIAHDLGLNAGDEVHRATVTDPQVIARITTQLDHLVPFPKGPIKCPMDDGEAFILRFTTGYRASPAVTASVGAAGCRTVRISHRGHKPTVYRGTQDLALLLTRLDP